MAVVSTLCFEGMHSNCTGRAPHSVEAAFGPKSAWGKCECGCHTSVEELEARITAVEERRPKKPWEA